MPQISHLTPNERKLRPANSVLQYVIALQARIIMHAENHMRNVLAIMKLVFLNLEWHVLKQSPVHIGFTHTRLHLFSNKSNYVQLLSHPYQLHTFEVN